MQFLYCKFNLWKIWFSAKLWGDPVRLTGLYAYNKLNKLNYLQNWWFKDNVFWLCPADGSRPANLNLSAVNETLVVQWLTSLSMLMRKSFWWRQCNVKYKLPLPSYRLRFRSPSWSWKLHSETDLTNKRWETTMYWDFNQCVQRVLSLWREHNKYAMSIKWNITK